MCARSVTIARTLAVRASCEARGGGEGGGGGVMQRENEREDRVRSRGTEYDGVY